jgi:hypothetical protein
VVNATLFHNALLSLLQSETSDGEEVMAEKKDTSGAPQHECLAPNDEGAAPGGPSTVNDPGTSEPATPARGKSCLRFLLEIIKSEKAKCL